MRLVYANVVSGCSEINIQRVKITFFVTDQVLIRRLRNEAFFFFRRTALF